MENPLILLSVFSITKCLVNLGNKVKEQTKKNENKNKSVRKNLCGYLILTDCKLSISVGDILITYCEMYLCTHHETSTLMDSELKMPR
jgi:hypothetical protein